MGRFDLGEIMARQADTLEQSRDIETITGEILEAKRVGGEAILTVGRCLIEAKEALPHGKWLPWLNDKVGFSERSARRFMQLYRECTNRPALADLGAAKALTLLALPAEEREQFMAERHQVDGEEKAVVDMTSRELEKAIRERKEAQAAAERSAADARAAEQARAKMEADMAALKQLYEAAQADAAAQKDKAGQSVREAEETAERLRRELEALRATPVDVAVMAVDQEALDKARAEAAAEMQGQLDRAKEQQARAEEKRKAAEAALAEANSKLEMARAEERKAVISGDKDLATFELLFTQAQDQVNKLHGLLLKIRGRGDAEMATKLQSALLALADAVRGCAG